MRRYYYCSYVDPAFFYVRQNLSVWHKGVPPQLEQAIDKYQRKYVGGVGNNYFVWPRLFCSNVVLIKGFYFFEENGMCFEFFSGSEVGHMYEDARCQYVYGKICETIYIRGGNDCNGWDAVELTPSQFAYDVKKYMMNKDKICTVMKDFLNIHYAIMAHKEQQGANITAAQRERDRADSKWVDDFLNKR